MTIKHMTVKQGRESNMRGKLFLGRAEQKAAREQSAMALVQMESAEDAAAVVEKLDGKQCKARQFRGGAVDNLHAVDP